MGDGTAFELLRSSPFFDSVANSASTPLDPAAMDTLASSDIIVSVCDFDFALELSRHGLTSAFVDPLFWLWDKPPYQQLRVCSPYYALDFPGLGDRTAHSPTPAVHVIPQIAYAPYTRGGSRPHGSDHTILVHFGGMTSPLGCNIDLAQALVADLYQVQTQFFPRARIKVRCGCHAADMIRSRLPEHMRTLDIGGRTHDSFQRELATCDRLLTVPGMSIVFEAASIKCPTAFLLPMNYSQHRQQDAYRTIFPSAPTLSWNDLPGYSILPAGLPETVGVERALRLGKRLSNDPDARDMFRSWARQILEHALPALTTVTDEWNPSGADRVADDILSALAARSG